MTARRAARILCTLILASTALPLRALAEEGETAELRERLTEREDKRRPPNPFQVDVGGRPLVISGEWEAEVAGARRIYRQDGPFHPDRVLVGSELEVELFYSLGPPLSLFLQGRVIALEDLLGKAVDEQSDVYLERGEMWLYSEGVAGLPLNFDVGRLPFEDDRRWWWDEELDAARLEWEGSEASLAVAVAYELSSQRSDRPWIEPENERVFRVLGEATWDWSDHHVVELFLLHADDHSSAERTGTLVRLEREDDSDGRLTWIGARSTGVVELGTSGLLGYWLDAAAVRGTDRLVELEESAPGYGVVVEGGRRDVSGWALDVGLDWLTELPLEPRFFVGHAFGSGDTRPDRGTDHSFHQTRLQANEAGFGGVERFASYGVLLDPELSNLHIATAGIGIALLRSSSLDLVYHYYRQVEPTAGLDDSRIEADLTGRDRDLGHAVDLVLALEEWERLEFEAIGSAFAPGEAFARDRSRWSYGGFFAVRWSF